MISDRYEEVNALLDRLLEMPPQERALFLQRSCAADRDLQETLEGVLAAYESADGFIDVPALVLLENDQSARPARNDLSGSVLGGYKILGPLGAGALAEVWLAKDERLQRRVALKILRSKFLRDPNQVLRFQQEARAASQLSHPNVVTIYETSESEGFHFIAQEFIAGTTLRERLGHGLLPLDLVLEIALQVVAALAAAHKSGIVHRDIKPENLMIRTDGLLKVVDFGIARVIEEGADLGNDWRQAEDNLTIPGLVLGTVKYMSPEQARGRPLDHRSDIFSVGVVLYEMATGRAPFNGATPADTLAAVLAHTPALIAGHRPDVPPELEQIVLGCLNKDRDHRISSAEDLGAHLKAVALKLRDPTIQAAAGTKRRSKFPRENASKIAVPGGVSGRGAPPPSKHWLKLLSAAAAVFVLFTLWWAFVYRGTTSLPFDSFEMTRLTLPGPVTDAAISPDGKGVAYLLQGSKAPSVWIRELAPNLTRRVTALEPGEYQDFIYSPDGAYLYYVQMTNLAATLYRIRLPGTRPEKVLGNVTGRISFAPDGRHIAFIRLDMTRWEESLIVANADGSDERKVATRRRPYYYSRSGVGWARDGKSIFCLAGKEPFYTANAYHLVQVTLSSGRETAARGRSWARVGSAISSMDGRMLIIGASEQSSEDQQLWRVSRPDGHVTRITRDLSNYTKLSLTADAETLLAIRRERTADVWTMPADNPDALRQISDGDTQRLNSAAWIQNSAIVYSASTGQFNNLWKMSAAGDDLNQLSRSGIDQTEVTTTPDGRYVLYQAGGKIWRMNADGSGRRQLTNGNLDVHPVATPDSRWIVYASFQGWSPAIGGRPAIWKVPISGGKAIQVTTDTNSTPAVSPDGKLIACAYFTFDKPQSTAKIGVYPFEGGPALKVFDRPNGSDDKLYWSSNGSSLEYIVSQGDVSNIWRQSLQGGAPAPMTHFDTDRIFFLSSSPDGKQIVLGRGKELTDLVLLTQPR